MENITFLMSKNLFLEIKNQSGPRPTYVAAACVRGPKHAYIAKISEA